MKTQTDKTQEPRNSITPRVASEASNGGTAQLKDNRTSTIAQRQLQQSMGSNEKPIQRKTSAERSRSNNTGLPDKLKSGIENLSGYSMDDVKVHYNSSKPAQLRAHAYAQGTEIHLAPGQEKHLPHEAWHVVQQKQGRVKPTRQLKSKVNINDDAGLEKESDVMGAKALREKPTEGTLRMSDRLNNDGVLQQQVIIEPNANIRLGEEQPIQAKWVRNKTTGETRTFVDGEEINEETHEILQDRFMRSGDELRFGPNYNIDPDVVGGENGVTEIPEEFQRPDDVERHINYRRAIHQLQDIYFFIDKEQENHTLAGTVNTALLRFQDTGKTYAKEFKKDKRDLSQRTKSYAKRTYVEKMNELTEGINRYIEVLCAENGIQMTNQDRVNSKNTWRERWKAILSVVEGVLQELWPQWIITLKRNIATVLDIDEAVVRRENWKLSFGGSLGKGYKGPPKQNVRFVTTRFDVDANMDADSIANYLLNRKNRKVDRGTIKVEDEDDADILVKRMDRNMDSRIKTMLVHKDLATNETVDTMVSEPFETLINTNEGKLEGTALEEWTRSNREQQLRDEITKLNGTKRSVITSFIEKVQISEFRECLIPPNEEENRYLLKSDPLTPEEIEGLEKLLEDSKKTGFFKGLSLTSCIKC